MRILTVVGTRPQLIKAAPVARRLAEAGAVEEILHTGQHYDAALFGDLIDELDLPEPKHHLGIGSGPHGRQTGRMLEGIEDVLLRRTPDLLLTYGDTNSTLAGALAAAKVGVPVVHVEAGVRSFDPRMPEEINRVLTDRVAALALAPTRTAENNLLREGFDPDRIRVVGDPMLDAFLEFRARAADPRSTIDAAQAPPEPFVLATVHRQENTEDPQRLAAIFEGLAAMRPETAVLVPLHPRTRAALERDGRLDEYGASLQLLPPVTYLQMLALEQAAQLIVTDSGGVQREAFFASVPCVVLRDCTEWPELVDLGWSRLVDPVDDKHVADAVRDGLRPRARGKVSETPTAVETHPLGKGDSAVRIVEEIERFVQRTNIA